MSLESLAEQVVVATGLSKDTVTELFRNGWTFTQGMNDPLTWTLPVSVEKRLFRE